MNMGLLDFSEFGADKGLNLYDQEEAKGGSAGKGAVKKPKTKEEIELEALFDKTYTCPVCKNKVTEKKVRSGKIKLLGSDMLLRARYEQLDPTKYGTIVCHKCGYAALDRFFESITTPQKHLIQENVTPKYKAKPVPEGVYSYDYALEMHKLALFDAVVKKSRASERAYICLKMAWLCQGKMESTPEDAPDRDAIVAECTANMKELYKNACDGFSTAMGTEPFPMCGMDDMTVTYLIAALNMEIGEYDKALKILSEIIVSSTVKNSLKDKARDLRDEIQDRRINSKK
jgi:uncharacterized protein (DUF2225 family)